MEHYELFLETEKRNIRLTKKHYSKELERYIECINLLTDTFQDLCNTLKPLDRVQACILFNCARIINSLGVFIDLLMKGHYYDSCLIRRSLLESAFLIECFIKDEKYAAKWMQGKLKFSKVKEVLELYTWESFIEYYDDMCDFVHANAPAILTFVKLGKSPEAKLFHTPKFELGSPIAIHFFPIIGFRTLVNLHTAYHEQMNSEIRSQIEKSLESWKIELDKLYDEMNKESSKDGT